MPPTLEGNVREIYRRRFPDHLQARRNAVWRILCSDWLERFVPPTSRVLEVGAGYCEFINNVTAENKTAVDLNPDTSHYADANVSVLEVDAARLSEHIPAGSVDVVFMSNFLEHCRSRDHMLDVLRNVKDVLAPGGQLLILGPNYRYCYRRYYDYFDHHLALSEKAVVEALELVGLDPKLVLARTLPFSFRGRLPTWPWLVRAYLHLPFLWPIFGAQFFVAARSE